MIHDEATNQITLTPLSHGAVNPLRNPVKCGFRVHTTTKFQI